MSTDISDVMSALGKAEALEILKLLRKSSEGYGFNQLKKELQTDPKTLTRRLDELTEYDLVFKDDSNYHLTPTGEEVLEYVEEISAIWGRD